MPIYEYQCDACGTVNDIKHGFKEKANEPCSQCGGVALTRLFNAAGIVFKGSGFYVTDSRKSNKAGNVNAEAKGDAAAPATEAKTEAGATKGEAKSDAGTGKGEAKSESVTSKSEPRTDSGGKGDAAA